MNIVLAKKEDAMVIAKIHKEEIKQGFLSSLGVSFLANFYQAIIESGQGFCLVAKENGETVGFICGVFDLGELYDYFIKKYFLKSIVILYKKFFHFSFVKKIFETLLYPSKDQHLPRAELLTLAVKKEFQSRGIASLMFEKLVEEFRKRGIKNFKVLVGEELKPAIGFYEKMGLQFLKNTELHENKNSRIYIYNV